MEKERPRRLRRSNTEPEPVDGDLDFEITELINPCFTIKFQQQVADSNSERKKKRLSKKLEKRRSASYASGAVKIPNDQDEEMKSLVERSKGLVGYSNKPGFNREKSNQDALEELDITEPGMPLHKHKRRISKTRTKSLQRGNLSMEEENKLLKQELAATKRKLKKAESALASIAGIASSY